MSLIDPSLFKGGSEEGGGQPFASAYASPRRHAGNFVDARPLTAWVRGLLYLEVGVYGLMLATQLLNQLGVTTVDYPLIAAAPTWEELYGHWTTWAVLAVAIIRGVFCLRWMWRANKNAHALSSGIETSPGWAWGAFFVPIWNLFKPFQTMSEIWRSAEDPLGWRGLATPAIIWVWWGLWLGGGLYERFVQFVGANDLTPYISLAIGVALNLVFAWMVDHVARRQVVSRTDTVFD